MRKIVPFTNQLEFSTDVVKITAISLEHEIKKEEGSISGEFFISGEYKITDGQLECEKFNFELPFDIAFGCNYKLDTLAVSVDDFRYELIDNNKLKVNIDLVVDGEEIMEPIIMEDREDESEVITNESVEEEPKVDIDINNINVNDNENSNNNVNIFNGFNEESKYVTYRVYTVSEGDTIDKIMEKYDTSREELSKYNGNLDIKVGDKLIIPANDK